MAHLEIVLEDKIYIQRTSHSKFIEFTLDGAKLNSYEELPNNIQSIANKMETMTEDPKRYFEYKHLDYGVMITNILPTAGSHIKIPDFIDGRPVIELGPKLTEYIDPNMLIQVQLPETIKKLGFGSFKDAKKLQYINIPKNLESISDECFMNTALINIDLSNIKSIGNKAFYNCQNINNMDLSNATDIGEYAFAMCRKLQNVSLSQTLRTLRDGVFRQTNIENIHLPECLERLGDGVFEECKNLKNINFPNALISIENYCFHKCENLKEFIAPSNLEIICEGAFAKTGLEYVKLNAKLKEVEGAAFNKCANLIEIILHHPTAYFMRPFDLCDVSKIKVLTSKGDYTTVKLPDKNDLEK